MSVVHALLPEPLNAHVAERRRGATTKLVYRTTYDTPSSDGRCGQATRPVRLTVKNFANGVRKISWGPGSSLTGHKRRVNGSGTSNNKEDNRLRSNRRSRVAVSDKVLSIDANLMETLTSRRCVSCLDEWLQLVRKYLRTMRRWYPARLFVGTHELQKRGAWHSHIAWSGGRFLPAELSRKRQYWQSLLDGEGSGSVNLKDKSVRYAASYLCKYITKTFDVEWPPYAPRYIASRGIEIPTETVVADPHEYLSQWDDWSYIWEKDGCGYATNA